jgi:hypothetical protein
MKKDWNEFPTQTEVITAVRTFFQLLKEGNTDKAYELVEHAFNDWEHQLWSLWQDTFLIWAEDQEIPVRDESFEGESWREKGWYSRLDIEPEFLWGTEGLESPFHVVIKYDGLPTDVCGEFQVVKNDVSRKYCVRRNSMRIA